MIPIVTLVSSDPHAWLRPLYARLRADSKFGLLAPAHQFEMLAKEVEKESPLKASTMREWTSAAQLGLLKWLNDLLLEQPNPINQIELWRVKKERRELVCVAVYLPIGIDVRLMEGQDFRRTKLAKAAPEVEAIADTWRDKLLEADWLKIS